MNSELLELLNYKGVIGALASTPDGLVISAVGLGKDDAEIVGAASSTLWANIERRGESHGSAPVADGEIHLVIGDELALIALTEADVPHDQLSEVMSEQLERVTSVIG